MNLATVEGGGFIMNEGENMIIDDIIIEKNFALQRGGGIMMRYLNNVTFSNSQINSNFVR